MSQTNQTDLIKGLPKRVIKRIFERLKYFNKARISAVQKKASKWKRMGQKLQ